MAYVIFTPFIFIWALMSYSAVWEDVCFKEGFLKQFAMTMWLYGIVGVPCFFIGGIITCIDFLYFTMKQNWDQISPTLDRTSSVPALT